MPSIPTTAIRVARRFAASPARVFDAWLDRRLACQWLFATAWRPAARMDIDARVGGRLRIVERRFDDARIEYRGEILQIARPRRIAFSLTVAMRRSFRASSWMSRSTPRAARSR